MSVFSFWKENVDSFLQFLQFSIKNTFWFYDEDSQIKH